VFSVATSAAVAVTLDAPQTVGTLQFGNSGNASFGYTLNGSGSNTLALDNLGTAATITLTGGMHDINAPVILHDDLVVAGSGGSAWTLSFGTASSITDNGSGFSLTMDAVTGTLILSGSDNYTGGTFVTAGTLEVTAAAALPEGSSLTIGANAAFVFDPTGTATALAASPEGSVAPVPEPGTLVLLQAGAMLAAFAASRQRKN
jgi:fibronectin-binding autotransporter adhesin